MYEDGKQFMKEECIVDIQNSVQKSCRSKTAVD